MKLIFVLLVTTALISGIFLLSSAQAGESIKGAHIVAYYFHGTMRCPTCHKLEQYSKEAIETNFKKDIASGKIEFKEINIDHKGNEHYAGDYQLYTKSLVLSLVRDGKEVRWKNLDKIWEYVRDKERFVEYVKAEVSNFLRE